MMLTNQFANHHHRHNYYTVHLIYNDYDKGEVTNDDDGDCGGRPLCCIDRYIMY